MSKPEPVRAFWRREVVLYRGDSILDQGTVKEIAERRKILKYTVWWYTTPAGHRRADRVKDQSKAVRGVRI